MDATRSNTFELPLRDPSHDLIRYFHNAEKAILNAPNLIQILTTIASDGLEEIKEKNGVIDEKHRQFLENRARFLDSCSGFSPRDRKFILRALKVATVAHQLNQDEDSRARKTGDLYIEHPLAIAQQLVDRGVKNGILIAIALLHDVKEDSSLEISPKIKVDNFEASLIEDPQKKVAWDDIIRVVFGRDYGALMVKNLAALRETPYDEIPEDIIEKIKNSLIFTLFKNAISEPDVEQSVSFGLMKTLSTWYTGTPPQPPESSKESLVIDKQDKDIVRAIYSLYKIIELVQKDSSLLPALIIKVLDIWHNAQTVESIGLHKLPRLRLASMLSTMVDFRNPAEDLVKAMSFVTNTADPNAHINKGETTWVIRTAMEEPLQDQLEHVKEKYIRPLCNSLNAKGIKVDMEKDVIPGWALLGSNQLKEWGGAAPPSVIITVDKVAYSNIKPEDLQAAIGYQVEPQKVDFGKYKSFFQTLFGKSFIVNCPRPPFVLRFVKKIPSIREIFARPASPEAFSPALNDYPSMKIFTEKNIWGKYIDPLEIMSTLYTLQRQQPRQTAYEWITQAMRTVSFSLA